MSMTRRGQSGRITKIAEQEDGALICSACSHIIFSRVNLAANGSCPHCHNPIDRLVTGEILDNDTVDEGDDIALPC